VYSNTKSLASPTHFLSVSSTSSLHFSLLIFNHISSPPVPHFPSNVAIILLSEHSQTFPHSFPSSLHWLLNQYLSVKPFFLCSFIPSLSSVTPVLNFCCFIHVSQCLKCGQCKDATIQLVSQDRDTVVMLGKVSSAYTCWVEHLGRSSWGCLLRATQGSAVLCFMACTQQVCELRNVQRWENDMASRKHVLTAVWGVSRRVVKVCCEVSEECTASVFRVTIWVM